MTTTLECNAEGYVVKCDECQHVYDVKHGDRLACPSCEARLFYYISCSKCEARSHPIPIGTWDLPWKEISTGTSRTFICYKCDTLALVQALAPRPLILKPGERLVVGDELEDILNKACEFHPEAIKRVINRAPPEKCGDTQGAERCTLPKGHKGHHECGGLWWEETTK